MTFDYIILPEKRCIAQRFTGLVSLRDVMICSERMWADPRYDRTYNGISDLSLSQPGATPSEVPALVAFYKRPETSVGRWAAIFSEPKGTALGMLFKAAFAHNPWIDIYSSWEAACNSLAVEIPSSIFEDRG